VAITPLYLTPWAAFFLHRGNLDRFFGGSEELLPAAGRTMERIEPSADLPPGQWTVTRHDAMAKATCVLSREATGRFTFESPASRAVLFHFKRN
jgi:hypothetical protein